jgi:transcriptional regulator with XRE-family HTH domain
MSQENLGHECNLDRTFISSVERGIRNISIDNIERFANALNINPRDLLNPNLAAERGLDTALVRAPRSSSH